MAPQPPPPTSDNKVANYPGTWHPGPHGNPEPRHPGPHGKPEPWHPGPQVSPSGSRALILLKTGLRWEPKWEFAQVTLHSEGG
jgi:hypothetical protein